MESNRTVLRNFTGAQIYEAFEKNGLGQLREQFVNTDRDGNLIAGCMLTQGAVNLHTVPIGISESNKVKWRGKPYIGHNTLYHELNEVIVTGTDYYGGQALGRAITQVYDARSENYTRQYKYTYAECLKIIKGWLEPYWDRKFKLATRELGFFYTPQKEDGTDESLAR